MIGQPFSDFIKSNLKLQLISSFLVACLVFLTSSIGILNNRTIYTSSQQIGNLATDWTNLILALPILLISMLFVYKENVLGLLLWPSSLLYFVFVYLFYSISVPFSWTFLLFIIITSISGFTFLWIFTKIEGQAVHRYFDEIPSKLVGGILVFFGIGFFLIDLVDIMGAVNQTNLVNLDDYVPWIVDFTIGIPILLIAGYLMWKKDELGYVLSPSLLLYMILLDIGVTILYIFKWVYQEPDFEVEALITFFLVSIITLIPLYYFFKKSFKGEKENIG